MGYEIKMIVGKSSHSSDEIERDMSKPFSDGSGYEYKKDANGDVVKTGRRETFFHRMAQVDLCKLGYQDDALNLLIQDAFKKGKSDTANVYYFYDMDGNTDIREDRYGEKMYPVPIADALKAMEKSHTSGYRRLSWAIALLRAMVDDEEKLEVMFFGH